MQVEPELYCARWIRLLFSREVDHWKTMLPLWDVFFDLTSQHETILSLGDVSYYTQKGLYPMLKPYNMGWMEVLETTAASLIWIQRAQLLEMDPEDGFCWLVNMPPMVSVNRLMSTLLSTIRRIQVKEKPKRTSSESPKTAPESPVKMWRKVLDSLHTSSINRSATRRNTVYTSPQASATELSSDKFSSSVSTLSCAETLPTMSPCSEKRLISFTFPTSFRIQNWISEPSPTEIYVANNRHGCASGTTRRWQRTKRTETQRINKLNNFLCPCFTRNPTLHSKFLHKIKTSFMHFHVLLITKELLP